MLDFEIWEKHHDFKQSIASVLEVTDNTCLLLGSVHKQLTNLYYKNNEDFRNQWKNICSNKKRLRYRNNRQLIVLCLPNETQFNLQTNKLVINIDEIISKIDNTYKDRQEKINYFLEQKDTIFDTSNLDKNDIDQAQQLMTLYNDHQIDDDKGVYQLEDDLQLAFQDPPPQNEVEIRTHKHNLRKQKR